MKSHNGRIYNIFQKKFPVFSMAMGIEIKIGHQPLSVGFVSFRLK